MFDKTEFPVIDAHIHIMGGIDSIEVIKKQKAQYGYSAANILSIEAMGDNTQNAKCIAYKHLSPGDYAFAGLNYKSHKDFLTQAKVLYDMGFDGFKMIEGKPDVRKQIGIALDDPSYDPFYSFLEEKELPLLLHAADPATFWDAEKTPSFAKENGWFYGDGSHLSKEEINSEVEGVLRKHRNLKLILAHFYFMSDDLDRAERLMDEFPNLHFDITPGTEMFTDFSRDINAAKTFFNKYQNRIIFGTDNFDIESEDDRDIKDVINNLLYSFLCSDKEFCSWDLKLCGINLEQAALENILYKNFQRLVVAPRLINKEKVIEYCTKLIESDFITQPAGAQTLREVINLF